MRFGRLHWTMVFVIALLAPCGSASPAPAEFISAETTAFAAKATTFVGEFRAFLNDFPRWDAVHLELPLIALAMTPESNRPAMLMLLWDLWMHDHSNTPTGAPSLPLKGGPPTSSPPGVSGAPGTGSGGGTISGTPGSPGGGGGTGGSPKSAPEPSSLALIAYGGLGLIAFRLVRFRRVRSA